MNDPVDNPIARLFDENKPPYRWFVPKYTLKHFSDDNEWKREHDEVSLTIRRQLFAIIMFSLFCILALGAPEINLISNEANIRIPFSNTDVSYVGFLFFGPLILIAMTIYLHIFIGYLNELGDRDGKTTLPFMFNMSSPIPKLLSTFLFYWLPPLVLLVFTRKAIARPDGQLLISVTAAVSLALFFIKIRRYQWSKEPKPIELRHWIIMGLLLLVITLPILSYFNVIQYKTLFTRSFNFYGSSELSGKDLSGAVLKNVILEKAKLHNTNLSNADLENANLRFADLENADLQNADLTGADLRGAKLETANLKQAKLYKTIIDENTTLSLKWKTAWEVINQPWKFTTYNKTQSSQAKLNLEDVNFSDLNLSFLNLENADMSNSNLDNVILDDSDLTGANLKNVMNPRNIQSMHNTVITKITNAPSGFLDWAAQHGSIKEKTADRTGTIFQDSFKDGSAGPEMVVIGPGRFFMGEYESESARLKYSNEEFIQKEFAIGKYEVTVGDFKKFIDSTHYKTEAEISHSCKALVGKQWQENVAGRNWRTPGFPQTDLHPVVCVSWNDAQQYLQWLNNKLELKPGEKYRLATEKEWEYVAREGGATNHYWNIDDSACEYANLYDLSSLTTIGFNWAAYHCDDHAAWTAPVNAYKPNKFNVNNMLGNVWEWVDDCYIELTDDIPLFHNILMHKCDKHVFKGGSWHYGPGVVYAGLRAGIETDKSGDLDGFRIAKTIRPSSLGNLLRTQ